jgi:hypothetical protein
MLIISIILSFAIYKIVVGAVSVGLASKDIVGSKCVKIGTDEGPE